MRTPAQLAGDAAETLAAVHLERAGWRILGRNVRVGRAEVDLIAVDPVEPALVFVEVRWRSRRDFGLPEETVDGRKLARLRGAAFALVGEGRLADGTVLPRLPLRLDMIAVDAGSLGRRALRHHRGIGA